jgi:hypothetical protein
MFNEENCFPPPLFLSWFPTSRKFVQDFSSQCRSVMYADPDPAYPFHVGPDPDPTFQFDAGPDPQH